MAVQAPLQFGVDQRDRGGAARRGRDQVHQRGAGAAHVLGRAVHDGLGVGHIMDRGDRPMANAKRLMDHLDHRGQAVGRARRRRHQRLRAVVKLMVHAIDKVQRAAVLDRGRDDDLFHPGSIIGRDLCGSFEHAGAVDHQIHAQFGQGQGFDGLFMRQPDGLAVQHQRAAAIADGRAPAAMNAVELHQERVLLSGADRVVQKHDLAATAGVDQVAQNEFSDAAKAVQGNPCHGGQAFISVSVPMASTRDCKDMRLRLSKGNSTKAAIRRRSAA